MGYKLLKVVRIYRVNDIKEELPMRCLAVKELVRHVLPDGIIVLDHVNHTLNGKLLNAWYCYERYLAHLKHLLLVHQEKLKEVFVDLRLWRKVELQLYIYKVNIPMLILTLSCRYWYRSLLLENLAIRSLVCI